MLGEIDLYTFKGYRVTGASIDKAFGDAFVAFFSFLAYWFSGLYGNPDLVHYDAIGGSCWMASGSCLGVVAGETEPLSWLWGLWLGLIFSLIPSSEVCKFVLKNSCPSLPSVCVRSAFWSLTVMNSYWIVSSDFDDVSLTVDLANGRVSIELALNEYKASWGVSPLLRDDLEGEGRLLFWIEFGSSIVSNVLGIDWRLGWKPD